MKAHMEFNAVFEKRGRWYIAYVEELPGVNTQGRSLNAARENLKEALKMVIEANRELASQTHPSGEVMRELISLEA